jgi:hypothetical protein
MFVLTQVAFIQGVSHLNNAAVNLHTRNIASALIEKHKEEYCIKNFGKQKY